MFPIVLVHDNALRVGQEFEIPPQIVNPMQQSDPTQFILHKENSAIPAISRWILVASLVAFLFHTAEAQVKTEQKPSTSITDAAPAPGSMGWSAFTENDRLGLQLSEDQMAKLKEVDTRFDEKYKAMGIEPWTNEKFPELNSDRNQAVQDILSPEQYQRWAEPTAPVPAAPPTIIPDPSPEK